LLIKLPGFLKSVACNSGDIFALYVAGYTAGRLWIEALRIDEANYILGLRLNIWVSVIVFTAAAIYLYSSNRRGNTSDKPVAS
jgi:prolipoprotein diacylglyceryltransferase